MKTFGSFSRNRQGQFALTLALTLPFLLGGVGLAFDTVMLVNQRDILQNSLDAASLSAVSALAGKKKTTEDVKAYAVDFMSAQLSGQMNNDAITALKTAVTVSAQKNTVGTKTTYTVSMSGKVKVQLTPFSAFLGKNISYVGATSTTSSAVVNNALSLYLVVDRSGSMSWVTSTKLTSATNANVTEPEKCQNYEDINDWGEYPNLAKTAPCYMNKIAALKNAAANLFDTIDAIEAQDTTNTIARTGAVSFTDSQQTASALDWGTTTGRAYIKALPEYPTGGTDMSDALSTAYSGLTAPSETTAHKDKSNSSFSKFIVLMTDGENTGASSKWKPSLDTKTLATCTAARAAGVTIYTVAFMAPSNGKSLLLSCSGSSSNSFEAESASQLTAAFEAIGQKVSDRATKLTN